MISFISSRISTRFVSLALATAVAATCSLSFAQTMPTTAPATQAAAATQQSDVLAVVNGDALSRNQFYGILTTLHGLNVFQSLESIVVVEQACRSAGISVGEAQDQAEKDRMLNALAEQGVPENQRELALGQLMESKGVSQLEFRLTIHRSACLRALAKGKVTVNDDDIQQAFDAVHGERVRVRYAQVKSIGDGAEIVRLVEKEGKPFVDVAQEHSLPLAVADISANSTNFPKSIKDAAFQHKEREISSVITVVNPAPTATDKDATQTAYYILYVEKKSPKDVDAKLDDAAKAKIRTALLDQREAQWGQNHLQFLLQNAHVEIKDPLLGAVYTDWANRVEASRKAAATQPSTQPTTFPAPATSAPAAPKPK